MALRNAKAVYPQMRSPDRTPRTPAALARVLGLTRLRLFGILNGRGLDGVGADDAPDNTSPVGRP
ncbi:hypothetical protein ACFWFZ_17625 [Streptomyces sp. NPDC060232]|uniref:hypothetical protein n=1 Tax=Streptomyces sp. NPDC060232 TaxID=3347079 RepID=UPI003647C0FA